jgi:hypothetical protein
MIPRQIGLLCITVALAGMLAACGSSSSGGKTPTTLPDGNYVFHVSGWDIDGLNDSPLPYFIAGAFTVSSGAITGGEEDFVDPTAALPSLPLASSGNTIQSTKDGNLQITLNVGPNAGIGESGLEIFNTTLTSTTSASIVEFDSFASGSGSLDPQSSMSAPANGYAFFSGGFDSAGTPLAFAGVINVDQGQTISGGGSVLDLNDALNQSGGICPNQGLAASAVSVPDSLGRVQFTLNPTGSCSLPQIVLVGYIVDSSKIQLVETTDELFGTTGGIAYSQGATNTGNFTDNSLSGSTYVVAASGENSSSLLQFAGALGFNSGGVTGNVTYNDTVNPVTTGITAGSFTVHSTGRVSIHNLTANGFGPATIQLYLDGNGNATGISMDLSDVTAGVGFSQTANASFSGSYAFSPFGYAVSSNGPVPFNAVGPIATGSGGGFTGFTDYNLFTSLNTNIGLTGTSSGSSGLLTGTILGLDPANTTDNFTYYVIDSNRVVAIQDDTSQLTLGFMQAVSTTQ